MNNKEDLNIETQLSNIKHYKKFPSLKPFIGPHYYNANKKILFVGESHYLPPNSKISHDANTWYGEEHIDITEEEEDWMNTRLVLNGNWSSKGHRIYKEINKLLKVANVFDGDRQLDYCAFMNGFQRPASTTGDSIKKSFKPIDQTESFLILDEVIALLNPDIIVFISKFTWTQFGPQLKDIYTNKIIDYTVHPAAFGLWNNKTYENSKYKILNLLSH